MKAMVVRAANQPLVAEERPVPEPGRGEVRIRVHACGVCHSDQFVAAGGWPGLVLPRVPGHEIAGVIDAVGEGVTRMRRGDRVGVGWHGGQDGTCRACLDGRFIHCEAGLITGITSDGGYEEMMIAPISAVAPLPDELGFAEAAPLLCAGVTTFNALRHAGARSGDRVAVHGLGGLGHLGVQYANKMGFEVIAIARGAEKEEFAKKLGASRYVDSERKDAVAALSERGGIRVLLTTVTNADAISRLVPALSIDGCLLVVGAPLEPMAINAVELIMRSRRIQGWASGASADSADALAFAARTGVRPIIERFPLADAQAALDRMMSGKARFRAVLEIAS
jgi:D-arabinose 1-dehydrogenase-like Zn-dependent alcohol dehydrogenase